MIRFVPRRRRFSGDFSMKKLFSILLLVMFVGCSPVYKTFYTYEPMRSANQRSCASNCQLIRQSCEINQQQGYQLCLSNARLEYQNCKSNERWGYNSKGKYECQYNCYCYESSCSEPNLDQCEAQYATCYTGCGGKVTSVTRCIENCESVQNPPTQ